MDTVSGMHVESFVAAAPGISELSLSYRKTKIETREGELRFFNLGQFQTSLLVTPPCSSGGLLSFTSLAEYWLIPHNETRNEMYCKQNNQNSKMYHSIRHGAFSFRKCLFIYLCWKQALTV